MRPSTQGKLDSTLKAIYVLNVRKTCAGIKNGKSNKTVGIYSLDAQISTPMLSLLNTIIMVAPGKKEPLNDLGCINLTILLFQR